MIDLTADEHDGEPAAPEGQEEEPDHLRCPITHEMFRDPVVLQSGHTYEREAIEQHLRNDRTDPLTRARLGTSVTNAPVTNRIARNAVQAWLDENPGVTPDGWKSRGMLPLKYPNTNSNGTYDYNAADVVVLCRWRESCPELRDLWRGNCHLVVGKGHLVRTGRVTGLCVTCGGDLPHLEGFDFTLECVSLSDNQLSGPIPEKLFEGLTSLQYVILRNNQLSGPISEKLFEGLTALLEVDLSDNQLTGPIPEKLFEGLTSLEKVHLPQNNQLTGPIPEKLLEGV